MYTPAPLPKVSTDLGPYVRNELERIAAEFAKPTITLPILYVQPAKPRDGLLAAADGVSWDPGSGRGLYRYNVPPLPASPGWEFLG